MSKKSVWEKGDGFTFLSQQQAINEVSFLEIVIGDN